MNATSACSLTNPRMNDADVCAKSDETNPPAMTVAAVAQRCRVASATSGMRRYGLHSATPIVAAITQGDPASASDIARNVIAIDIASGENEANMNNVIGRSAQT